MKSFFQYFLELLHPAHLDVMEKRREDSQGRNVRQVIKLPHLSVGDSMEWNQDLNAEPITSGRLARGEFKKGKKRNG